MTAIVIKNENAFEQEENFYMLPFHVDVRRKKKFFKGIFMRHFSHATIISK
jgi:hypothetical protein